MDENEFRRRSMEEADGLCEFDLSFHARRGEMFFRWSVGDGVYVSGWFVSFEAAQGNLDGFVRGSRELPVYRRIGEAEPELVAFVDPARALADPTRGMPRAVMEW